LLKTKLVSAILSCSASQVAVEVLNLPGLDNPQIDPQDVQLTLKFPSVV